MSIKTPGLPKIFAVIGPTASGKSEYAVKLAKEVGGEIISADSRQVYRSLDIGTGKVPGKWKGAKSKESKTRNKKVFIYKGVKHYCIDFISARRQYSVADFKRDAEKAIVDILARGKTPILCGGTGQYIDVVVFNQSIPEVLPNAKLRAKLEAKNTTSLFKLLQKKDPERAITIDAQNKRRIIRSLEIIEATGQPVPIRSQESKYEITWVYLNPPRENLYQKIAVRLKQRLQQGMVTEVATLHAHGISWQRLEDLGLEYRYISRYLRKKISYSEMAEQLLQEIKRYAKRQQTWFRKYEQFSKNV